MFMSSKLVNLQMTHVHHCYAKTLCQSKMRSLLIIIINAIGVISGLRLNPTKTKTLRKFSLKTALPNDADLLIMNFRQFKVSEMRISHYRELFKLVSLCHGIC